MLPDMRRGAWWVGYAVVGCAAFVAMAARRRGAFDCTSKLAECIESGRAQVQMEWDFPTRDMIKLDVPKPNQPATSPSIDLSYTSPPKAALGAGL